MLSAKMKKLWLLCGVLLLFSEPVQSVAHEIHLKDGRVIKTDSITRQGSKLTYQQFGGTITIDLTKVEKITYDNKPAPRRTTSATGSKGGVPAAGSSSDLAAQLEQKLSPATPVERANLAVVTIATEAGSGSGFFISDNGLIVTNRHVIRGSKAVDRSAREKIDEASGRLKRIQTNLDSEGKRLENYKNSLETSREQYQRFLAENRNRVDQRQRAQVEANLKQREQYLEQWRVDYSVRRKEFEKTQAEFNRKRQEYFETGRKLAAQTRFEIILADGRKESAVFYRVSEDYDLALLKLDGFTTPYLRPHDRGGLQLGQTVYAIGSPLQLNNTVTSGVISNSRGDFIQTNAEIYPGNSGGPLITEDGRVVGINTMKKITEKFEGLGFAIKFARVQSEFGDYLQ